MIFALFLSPTVVLAGPLPPELVEGGVQFTFEDPVAENVNLAGEFNQWNDKSLPMTLEGEKFVLVVPLNEGKYKYKYVVDGQWMSGEELTLNIIRRDGRLYIYPRQPYLRFPYSSRIDFDGYYLFTEQLSDDVDGPGGRIRSQTPRNDLDLNFDIHPTDILRAWAQLNINTVSNDDKVNLDEAFLELTLGKVMIRPFETHWNIDFDDPFRVLDEQTQFFDDNIYMTNDERPFFHQYGRYARGFSGDFELGKWLGQFFFSNKVRLDQGSIDEDFWGMRLRRKGRYLSWGLTFTEWQVPNGVKADENGDGNTTEKTVKNLGQTTIEYPDKSGTFYQVDFLTQITPGGQNRRMRTGVDAAVTFGGWTFLTELLASQNDAAAVAYSSGNNRRVFGFAYGQSSGTMAGFERVFGEQSDGLSLHAGFIYRGRSWANEVAFRFHNFRAKGFSDTSATTFDTSVKSISPEWFEFVHRLSINEKPEAAWRLEIESKWVDRSSISMFGNVFYQEKIGSGHYFYTDVPWARQTISEKLRFYWRIRPSLTWHTKYDWMDLARYGKEFGRPDVQTIVALSRLNWQFSEKWQMDLGTRFSSVDFGTIGGTDMNGDFLKGFFGFKYAWSKLLSIRFWFGIDPYLDEDKKLGVDWRVQDLFKPVTETVATNNQDLTNNAGLAQTLIGTERRFDQETVFAIQADFRF